MVNSILILRVNDGGALGLVLTVIFVGGGILYFLFPSLMGRDKKPENIKADFKDRSEHLFGALILGVIMLVCAIIAYCFKKYT